MYSLLLGRVSRESITLLFGYLWYEINMIWNTIFKGLIVSALFKIFAPNTITELSYTRISLKKEGVL